jgi:YVTN family beta-propeller protein
LLLALVVMLGLAALLLLPADPAGETVSAASLAGPPAPTAAPGSDDGAEETDEATTTTGTSTTTTTTTTTTLVPPDGLTAADRRMTEIGRIAGDISPKSVVSTQHGLFFAQNMMYRHTVTVYDRALALVRTIDDRVDLPSFGHPEFPGGHRGAPVEAAVTSDGAHVYVSNYEMYGSGFESGAGDGCNDGEWPDHYVYRIPAETLAIDAVIRVGSVPKYLAVTPDDRYLVVSNWCSFDLSIIDLATQREVARVEVGRHPRGIAITPDSRLAYVAVMGGGRIAVIDLTTFAEVGSIPTGRGPRHLVMAPDGAHLYLTLNGEGRVAKIDRSNGNVLASVATGTAPRSMDISDDGSAIYVVNYESGTVSKVRTADMVELEEHRTGHHPIGVTYDRPARQVWVANYSGTIQVFQDAAPS